ncbi:ribose 1,5-bisphosphate isomerase [Halorhabdus amylolytica]|uniref:ribose 1,5-bisphosphate isomerase n=1 Tax=Halorhabdus amylolytica TaxID=2559573 RepID=UPI0010AA3290|nr:ribose 1,5-bisphosphate isomerase [Halorhabdus amylolytica]
MTHQRVRSVSEQIKNRDIRGTATIARETAQAMEAQARDAAADTPEEFRETMRETARTLHDARPDDDSLSNALRYLFQRMDGETVESLRESVTGAARTFQENIDRARETLGRIGSRRLRDGDTVMIHSHSADALATLEHALADGKEINAFVKETRPRKQGHIAAQQLQEWDIAVTVIVDSAARRFLDDADHVLVGADSIAADGSVVNRIGTSDLAVIARERGVPVTVAAQTLRLHPDSLTGHSVDIETREEREVLDEATRKQIGDVAVENPAFDVTPARYVDAIVTERGQYPPESVVTLMRELYGGSARDPWLEG